MAEEAPDGYMEQFSVVRDLIEQLSRSKQNSHIMTSRLSEAMMLRQEMVEVYGQKVIAELVRGRAGILTSALKVELTELAACVPPEQAAAIAANLTRKSICIAGQGFPDAEKAISEIAFQMRSPTIMPPPPE